MILSPPSLRLRAIEPTASLNAAICFKRRPDVHKHSRDLVLILIWLDRQFRTVSTWHQPSADIDYAINIDRILGANFRFPWATEQLAYTALGDLPKGTSGLPFLLSDSSKSFAIGVTVAFAVAFRY